MTSETVFYYQPRENGTTVGGVPHGARTSEYYHTKNLPDKFEYPGNIVIRMQLFIISLFILL